LGAVLRQRGRRLGLQDCVMFLGPLAPERLKVPLSAADVFVLATSNEGWANVFLEAMACGLPVVTTDVGGNAEIVSDKQLGSVVPFGDRERLTVALSAALDRDWNRDAIVAFAEANSWDHRVERLIEEFVGIVASDPGIDLPGRAVRCA
jgi:glycosyltransferase involved in cell wall biosynthesis